MNIVSDIRESRGIIEISVDGCVILRVRKQHFYKHPLEVGDEVEIDEYENVIASIQFVDAYEAALTSLDYSARTAKQLERSLAAKGFVAAVVSPVIERLIENHLIDDKRIAERMVESSASKSVGIYALKRKLRAKGISEDDASEALDIFDDAQQLSAAQKTAEKLYRKYSTLPSREARVKLSQALARRGFPWDAVREAVDTIIKDEGVWE